MLNNLINWSIHNRFLVIILSLVWVAAGVYLSFRTNVDVFPEFAPPQVVLQIEAPGMVPEEVEALVTLPVEAQLNGMPGLRQIRSNSGVGVSSITTVFDFNTDLYRARQLVAERLQLLAARLPRGVGSPRLFPAMPAIGDVLKIAFVPQKTALRDLRALADWEIRNRLLAVPGVARVLVIGGEVKEYQVLIDPNKLQTYRVTVAEIRKAVESANAISAGGFLVSEDQQFSIQGVGRPRTIDELANSVVAVRDNVPVLLKHVARVQIGNAFKLGDSVINGKSGVYIYITKQPAVNTVDVVHDVQKAMESLKPSIPADVQVTYVFNQADFIQKSVTNVLEAIGEGAALVVVVLIIFLLNWRTSVVSLTAIPLSILTAVVAIKAFGGSINTMTLGGLAIAVGEVVDDAIIDVENVYRRLRENQSSSHPKPVHEVVYRACIEVRSSVVYATFIVALVFLPVFTLAGIEGRIFSPLGLSYITATMASLLVALTVTPAMCMYLLARGKSLSHHEPWTVVVIQNLYHRILEPVMRAPRTVLAFSTALFVLTISLLFGVGQAFLPPFRENSLIITAIARAGQSLDATTRMGKEFELSLLKEPEVTSVVQWAGRAELDDMAAGPNFCEFDVQLKPSDKPLEPTLKMVREHLERLPGVVADVGSFISHRMDEVLSGGTRAAIAIKIFGPDLPTLAKIAREVKEITKEVPGAVDVRTDPQVVVPRIRILIDREKAARYGVTAQDLMGDIETAFQGQVISQVLEGQRLFPLKLWLEEPFRNNLDLVKKLLIDTPTGARIPVSEIADVKFVDGPNIILREDVSRRVVVQANTSGRDVVGVVNDAKAKIENSVHLPQGYYIVYAGQYAAQREAAITLLSMSALTLLGIILLLYQGLKSWKLTLLVLSNLPLATVGGIIAVVLTGNILSVGSLIGFISLFGISTRNTILLATHINSLIEQGEPFDQAILRGAQDRVAPVLMTAITASLGMLPLAIFAGAGRELEQPLAIVIVGGMLSSTALTLIVIPALFKAFVKPPHQIGAKKAIAKSI
ncbi:MAG TPA: efflux RND transporter permease subunit [Candidatus Melainabacteria bacterium]|nr:efflux RND transporter permease subunit [Candidatus Melainabacteria bacterium]HIN64092.1 efflux RND transporter permease subunit [Candidatus Obscuribacterales bacterium]